MTQLLMSVILAVVPALTGEWWKQLRIKPVHNSIHGIPVRHLKPSWQKAVLLGSGKLPWYVAQLRFNNPIVKHDYRFRLLRDIDNDQVPEMLLVGNYLDRRGRTGRFLLILQKTPGTRSWRKQYLVSTGGTSGLHALLAVRSGIYWSQCILCDRTLRLAVQSGNLELQWRQPHPEQ